MWINWKRLTLGALGLAYLSLVLMGCSDFAGSAAVAKPADTINVSGVAYGSNGKPLANVEVSADALDATSGAVVGKATAKGAGKSVQAAAITMVKTDSNGRYTLKMPKEHQGRRLLITAGSFKTITPAVTNDVVKILVTPATDYVVKYIISVSANNFTPKSISDALVFLGQLMGINSEDLLATAPSTSGIATDPGARLLIVSNALQNMYAETDPTKRITPTDLISGVPAVATALNSAITKAMEQISVTAAPTTLQVTQIFTPTQITTLKEAGTPPTAPAGLTATATDSSVTLKWAALAGGNPEAVVSYYVYRDGTQVSILPSSSVSYTDTKLSATTPYTYTIKAVNVAGIFSSGSAVTITTKSLHTISGQISGVVSSGVVVTLSGTGAGSVKTDSAGNYIFTGVRSGDYIVTPSQTGVAFSPASANVKVADADATANFTSVAQGSVTGTPTYPEGSVVVTTTAPDGSVTVTVTYPDGKITVSTTYPDGTVTVKTTYPDGTVSTATTYPDGKVTVTTTYPGGSVNTEITYPSGSVSTVTTYPDGKVTSSTTYPDGTVTTSTTYPEGSVSGQLNFAYMVTGKITDSGSQALKGVSVTITNGGTYTSTTTTGLQGDYTFSGVPAGTYTITPVLGGYTFTAATGVAVPTVSGGQSLNVTGRNFAAQ